MSCERSSATGRSPKAATAFPSSQRSFSIVTGWTSCCCEVHLHEFGESQRPRDAALAPHPLQLSLQRFRRVPLRGEPATLHSLRVSTADSVPIRPSRLPVPASLQPDQLTLLGHRAHPSRRRNEVIVISGRRTSNGRGRSRATRTGSGTGSLCARSRGALTAEDARYREHDVTRFEPAPKTDCSWTP